MHRYGIYSRYFITKFTTPYTRNQKRLINNIVNKIIQLKNSNWFTKKNPVDVNFDLLVYKLQSIHPKENQKQIVHERNKLSILLEWKATGMPKIKVILSSFLLINLPWHSLFMKVRAIFHKKDKKGQKRVKFSKIWEKM